MHLCLSADDDGFCNQVSLAMFKAHAGTQDLEALIDRHYLMRFDSGVILVKHWRMMNALRKDRYTPTAYQEEAAQISIKSNGSYTWLPVGCPSIGKVSIGKNSIDKNREGNGSSYDYDEEIPGTEDF